MRLLWWLADGHGDDDGDSGCSKFRTFVGTRKSGDVIFERRRKELEDGKRPLNYSPRTPKEALESWGGGQTGVGRWTLIFKHFPPRD